MPRVTHVTTNSAYIKSGDIVRTEADAIQSGGEQLIGLVSGNAGGAMLRARDQGKEQIKGLFPRYGSVKRDMHRGELLPYVEAGVLCIVC